MPPIPKYFLELQDLDATFSVTNRGSPYLLCYEKLAESDEKIMIFATEDNLRTLWQQEL